jgi:hypothetical protein
MKTITTSKATIVLVELPEGVSVSKFNGIDNHNMLIVDGKPHSVISTDFELLGFAKDLTESQCCELIPLHEYYDIFRSQWAKQQLRKLIESHGFKWENCFLLKLK